MLPRGPLDPVHELTASERAGRYLLLLRFVVLAAMFGMMIMHWHRVYRRDVPCGAESAQIASDMEPEFITVCTGVVHPDGRAWLTPCLMILLFGAAAFAFRDQSRVMSIVVAVLTMGVVLALRIPINANLHAHPRVGTVGEPACHVYNTVEQWPQLGFRTLFYVLLAGSIIEIVTQVALAIRDWREDRNAVAATSK